MIHVNLIRVLLLSIYCAYILRSRPGLIFRALNHKVAKYTIGAITVVFVKDPDTLSPPPPPLPPIGGRVFGWRILTIEMQH